MLRVNLYHPNFGAYTIDDVDPEGLNNFEIELDRSKKHDGIFYEFSISLDFNKGARDYVKRVYDLLGIDGEVEIKIYEYDTNNYRFVLEYTGQLRLTNYSIDEATVSCTIEQGGFKRKFLNYIDTDVDVFGTESRKGEVLPDNSIIVPLAPKTIQKKLIAKGSDQVEFFESGYISGNTAGFHTVTRLGTPFYESDFRDNSVFVGLDFWDIPAIATDNPTDTRNYIFKAEEAGDYVIDLSQFIFDIRADVFIFNGAKDLTSLGFRVRYSRGLDGETDLYAQSLGQNDFDYSALEEGTTFLGKWRFEKYGQTLNFNQLYINDLQVGEEIYIWFEAYFDFDFGAGDAVRNIGYRLPENFKFTLSGNTVYPETQCKGLMIYEVLEKLVQYYTDSEVVFKSDFFGRKELGYDEDGQGAYLFVTNGALIRGLNKSLFVNYKELYDSLESIFCLGWTFEALAGNEIVRIEPKRYFYDNQNEALRLDEVANIKKDVVIQGYYQMIEVGYPKIENINQVNGIDEFNSLRRYTSPVNQSKGKLVLTSKYRASGFEIESQRRLELKTDESRLDEENFFVWMKKVDETFVVEQGIDYETVTGVFDPNTAYNLRITPARMADNWKEFLSISLWKSQDSVWKFSYGTFNYEVTSKYTGEPLVEESGGIDTDSEVPYYYLEEYTFEAKTDTDQRGLIRSNPNGIVSFLDWGNKRRYGFLLNLKMNIEGRKGVYALLRSPEPTSTTFVEPVIPPVEPIIPPAFGYTITYDYINEELYFAFEGVPSGTPFLTLRKQELKIPNVDTDYELIQNGLIYEVTIPIARHSSGFKILNAKYFDGQYTTQFLCNIPIIRSGFDPTGVGVFNKYGLRYVIDERVEVIIDFDTVLKHEDGSNVLAAELPIQSKFENFSGATPLNTELKTGVSSDPANINSIPTFHDLKTTSVTQDLPRRLLVSLNGQFFPVANSVEIDVNFTLLT